MVSKIFTHFKRTDASHKLGVLYVIDSVTRQWIEKAVSDGQDLTTPNTSDGTFAAGVKRVTELLPQLLNDLINNAPDDQKVHCSAAHLFFIAMPYHPTNVSYQSLIIGQNLETHRYLGARQHLSSRNID